MPRSLRWTLIAWYGTALLVVVAVFGATLHVRTRRALFTQVDDGLRDRAAALVGALDRDLWNGWEIDLDDAYLELLAQSGWFEIRAPDGKVIRSGGSVPEVHGELALGFHDLAEAREFVVAGPSSSRVRVGRSIAVELAELNRIAWFSVVAGACVLAAAIVGGSWLATRVLRPIARMSEAAGRISERDLTQRMDERAAPTELRDLSRTLNEAFARIESAFARQTRFTADASHELRTPLAIVRTQAELALRRDRTGPEYREALEACLRSAERMSRIVEALLALARADSGELAIPTAHLDLASIVAEVVRDARSDAAAAGVFIACTTEPVRVRGDAALLAELTANLVSNAIRYNRPGGRVDVAIVQHDGATKLSVTDDGIGIPNEALSHIFERFFRVDPARSRASGGSGLGLAIARAIAEAHGAQLVARSELGQGSTFTVILPALPPAVARAPD